MNLGKIREYNEICWGKSVPNAIKNQPWNLMGMPDRELRIPDLVSHQALHGKGEMKMNPLDRARYGTPDWFKAGIFSTAGSGVNAAGDK